MEKIEKKNPKIGYMLVLFSGIAWGTIGLFVTLLSNMGIPTGYICFFRIFFALIIILVIAVIWKGPGILKISKRSLLFCMLLGLICQAFYNVAYSESIIHNGLSAAVVVDYTSPTFTCIFSWMFFKENMGRNKLLALAINILGCVFTVTGGDFSDIKLSMYGVLMGLLGAVAYSFAPLFGRIAASEEDPLTIEIYMFIFALIFLGIYARPWEGISQIMSGYAPLVFFLYALIPTALTYIMYFKGLSLVTESGKVPVFASVETVVAALIGVTVFSEDLNIGKVIGIVLVLVSIYIMNVKKDMKKDSVV